jgi:hypothetical protein
MCGRLDSRGLTYPKMGQWELSHRRIIVRAAIRSEVGEFALWTRTCQAQEGRHKRRRCRHRGGKGNRDEYRRRLRALRRAVTASAAPAAVIKSYRFAIDLSHPPTRFHHFCRKRAVVVLTLLWNGMIIGLRRSLPTQTGSGKNRGLANANRRGSRTASINLGRLRFGCCNIFSHRELLEGGSDWRIRWRFELARVRNAMGIEGLICYCNFCHRGCAGPSPAGSVAAIDQPSARGGLGL